MIWAVDPGGTTGVAIWHEAGFATFHEIGGGHEGFVQWFDAWTHGTSVDGIEVVCESFIPRPGARSMQYDALYIIGFLKGWCILNHVRFTLQSPAQAKSFATNDKLKAAVLYPAGKGHAQDAARHLLVRLMAVNPAFWGERLRKILG